MGGYFLLEGKEIFSEFFYNHQPLMAYISFAIQQFTSPDGLYHLVLYHRVFIYALSLFFGVFLIYRFGFSLFLTLVIYEATKHYVFGDRFLAEGVAVYFLLYLFGFVTQQLLAYKHIRKYDVLCVAVSFWAVVFLREPYIPLAILLFMTAVFLMRTIKEKVLSIGIGLALSVATLLQFSFSEYWFNVVTVNRVALLSEESFSLLFILKAFFYPLFVVFSSEQTLFGGIIMGFSLLFIISLVIFLKTIHKNYLWLIFCFVVLGVANLRFTEPGKMYYEAFHMIIWYGLFLLMLFSMVTRIFQSTHSKVFLRFAVLFVAILILGIFSPRSFYFDHHDLQTDFVTQYGPYISNGEVVKLLSDDRTTLFLDGFDDMIYYYSGVSTSYEYSWFTSVMPRFKKYTEARERMFSTSPPDFYYGSCHYLKDLTLPADLEDDYIRFYFRDTPTCLHIQRSKLSLITPETQKQLDSIGYYIQGM